MKHKVRWIPVTKRPSLYQKLWVATRDGKVHRSERIGDTYFGSERLNFGGLGFLDLAVFYKQACNEVTHWAKYVEAEAPDAPTTGVHGYCCVPHNKLSSEGSTMEIACEARDAAGICIPGNAIMEVDDDCSRGS